jgi:protein O-mannosyl-transferase
MAACAAALLSWRALVGPFQIGSVWVRSPLTLEAIFTLLTGGLLLLACRRHDGAASSRSPAHLPLLLLALAVIALAFLPNLRDPFVSDDYILVGLATLDPHAVAKSFITAGGDGAFRPVGSMWYGLIHALFGIQPFPWHFSILVLHLLNCALLFTVTRVIWGDALLSFTAALLFGVHGSRTQVLAWASDNFDLVACALSLTAAWLLFRPSVRRVWLTATLALALLTLAILCKESAYAIPVIVFCLAAAAGRLRDHVIRVFLGGSVVVCVALFVWRWSLFHGPGGYLDPSTGRPAILSLHVVSTLKALGLRLWTILLFPLNWTAPTGVWIAAALLLGCGAVLFLLWSSGGVRPRVAVSMLAATLCAMVPVLHLAAVGESALGSRIYYLPALPFFVLAGHVVASVASRKRAALGLAALALSTLIVMEHNLSFWHRAALAADQVCEAAAQGKPVPANSDALPGLLSFGNGLKECVAMKRGK